MIKFTPITSFSPSIQSVHTDRIVIDAMLAGITDNDLKGAVITVTTGTLKRRVFVIADNIGTTLYLATNLVGNDRTLLSSASITISGGPLQDCTVIDIPPASVTDLLEQGRTKFVFVQPVGWEIGADGLERRNNNQNAGRTYRTFEVNVICQLPQERGSSPDDAYDKQTAIYVLSEQVLSRVQAFTATHGLKIVDKEPIKCTYGILKMENGTAEIAVMNLIVTCIF
jgi:hypothetical protein